MNHLKTLILAMGSLISLSTPLFAEITQRPNFIVINIDDLGYADIGPFGSKLNRTPNLDRMAKEGRKLTSFYAAPVCSPSRAGLMTGCYPKRVLPIPRVLFPEDPNGLSPHGIYSDWVEEMDWSVGQVLDTLRKNGLAENTLVIFTSDNGGTQRGVNFPLRGFKNSTWEGGIRVCTLAWWPGKIPAGTESDAITGMFDILPTFTALAGAEAPTDRKIDGVNIWPQLSGDSVAKPAHDTFYYYRGLKLEAVREGDWKLRLPVKPATSPELYNLKKDLAETTDVATQHPETVERIQKLVAAMETDLCSDGLAPGSRPLGKAAHPQPLIPYDQKD
jgi:arylsulfatase A